MATRATTTGHTVSASRNVVAESIIQGEQFNHSISIKRKVVSSDRVVPQDTTGWTMVARAEFYTSNVSESGDGETYQLTISSPLPYSSKTPVDLVTNAVDASMGEWEVRIPADLWDEEIAIDLERNVPTAAICVTMTDTTVNPTNIRRFRRWIVFRKGW